MTKEKPRKRIDIKGQYMQVLYFVYKIYDATILILWNFFNHMLRCIVGERNPIVVNVAPRLHGVCVRATMWNKIFTILGFGNGLILAKNNTDDLMLVRVASYEDIMALFGDVKKNGVALISLPNECTLYHRLKVLFGRGIDRTGFAPHYHLHFPTIKQNDEFIEKHFKTIEKRYWIHIGVGGKWEKLLSRTPNRIWTALANLYPSLFARGVIYLAKCKDNTTYTQKDVINR